MTTLYDYQGEPLFIEDGVEPYYENEVAATVASLKAAQTEPCLTFGLWTDVHYASRDTVVFPNTIRNFKAVAKEIRFDGVFSLGDMTDGDKTRAETSEILSKIMPMQRSVGVPVYFTAGNHDDNAYGSASYYFTTSMMYQNYYAQCSNDVVYDSANYGTNFYKDFDAFKIRLISLDAANSDTGSTPHYKYSGTTTTWFSNTMDSVPEGYMVIVITHLSPIASHNWNDTVPSNASSVKNKMQAFVDSGGDLVLFMGHSHADFSWSTPWLEIATLHNRTNAYTAEYTVTENDGTNLPVGAKIYPRTLGTVTEDCWDAVVIKPGSRTINMIRFGAGEDRTFTY